MRKLYALMTLAGLLPLGASAADVTVYGKVNTSLLRRLFRAVPEGLARQ